MSLTTPWIPLTRSSLQQVPAGEGVYELANTGQTIIYIGRSDDINRRLGEHLVTTDPCIREAEYFSYQTTNRSVERERELLEEYRRQHSRYPRCNDQ